MMWGNLRGFTQYKGYLTTVFFYKIELNNPYLFIINDHSSRPQYIETQLFIILVSLTIVAHDGLRKQLTDFLVFSYIMRV